jgi:mono/diheme cytochrome c family protein
MENKMTQKKLWTSAALFLGLSATAYAFPWDIDMVDSLFVRGYEKPMSDMPENTVSVNNYRATGLEHIDPKEVAQEWEKNGGQALIINAAKTTEVVDVMAGMEKDPATLQSGELAFRTYCQTCHGIKGTGKTIDDETWPLQQTGRFTGIPNIHTLADGKIGMYGAGAMKSNNELYLIIRNGRGKMPSYGHAMSEKEIWSAIHYIKALPGTSLKD